MSIWGTTGAPEHAKRRVTSGNHAYVFPQARATFGAFSQVSDTPFTEPGVQADSSVVPHLTWGFAVMHG